MTPAELKAIRKRYGLSQSEMARILRVSDLRTIRRWEKGERPVSGPASIILELMDSGELPQRYWGQGASCKNRANSLWGDYGAPLP